jgi:hypothetical protein
VAESLLPKPPRVEPSRTSSPCFAGVPATVDQDWLDESVVAQTAHDVEAFRPDQHETAAYAV